MGLFGQLNISIKNREGDLTEFFSHEIQFYPPSISDMGKLYLPGTKAQLIPYIVPGGDPEQPARFDCTVLDGAVVVPCQLELQAHL